MVRSSVPTQWFSRWQVIAQSGYWFFGLMALGSFSSALYPHPPLVAFATVAGATLPRRKALLAAIAIWFVNQILGYGLRGYPQTLESVAWGLLMGVSVVLVAGFATLRPSFSQHSFKGHWLWMAIALVSGFLLFQGVTLAFLTLLGGHGLNSTILAWLFGKELVWAIALTSVYSLLGAMLTHGHPIKGRGKVA
jgi:hypothetical protein